MPVILLTNYYSPKVLELVMNFVPKGFDFLSLEKATKDELVKKAGLADYFLVSGRLAIDKEVIETATSLKMIQRTGVGIDNLDIKYLSEKQIPVYVNKGINAISVAEHTIMLILATLRKLPKVDMSIKNGIWLKNEFALECHSLHTKTVGLIGLGNIGLAVAKMLIPFETRVLYYKPIRLPVQTEQAWNIEYKTFDSILRESDILSLHCPLNSNTKHLIGKKEISIMKPESIIINTARGQLIDEKALIEALNNGKIAGAALDVFEKEPVDIGNSLLKMDNVILTSHVGGLTFETFTNMLKDAFDNIRLFENREYKKIENNLLKI